MSAYSSSKSYSQRFRSGAEFVERNIGSPVASTVGNVGRRTGVESGLRWALQRHGSVSVDSKRTKRRKMNGESNRAGGDADVEIESGADRPTLSHRMRSSSDLSVTDSLPPYDDLISPSYDEVYAGVDPSNNDDQKRQTPSTWQSRLIISTSGLGIAMSDESLRSLQYCLAWLRWANGRLGKAMLALRDTLNEREGLVTANFTILPGTVLSRRILAVKDDVLSTLKKVVAIVSKYAGGALPENARNLVRRYLTSLPRRFQMASSSSEPSPADSSVPSSSPNANSIGAHRVMVLIREGLDILSQVSGVVNDTLVSAEHWCDRLGRKRSARNAQFDAQEQQETRREVVDVKEPVVRSDYNVVDMKPPLSAVPQGPDIQVVAIGEGQ